MYRRLTTLRRLPLLINFLRLHFAHRLFLVKRFVRSDSKGNEKSDQVGHEQANELSTRYNFISKKTQAKGNEKQKKKNGDGDNFAFHNRKVFKFVIQKY